MIRGLLYKTSLYKEKSLLCYLYTDIGYVSVLVNNALNYKSKFYRFSILLTVSNFSYTKSSLKKLEEYEVIKIYKNIYDSLTLTNYAFSIINILIQTKQCDFKKVLSFTISILDLLNNFFNPKYLLLIYLVKMLNVFGIRPDINKIKKCFILDNDISINNKNGNEILYQIYFMKLDNIINLDEEEIVLLLDYIIKYYEKTEVIYFNNIYKLIKL